MIAGLLAAEEGIHVAWGALGLAVVLLALNGFFVAAEFALLASRRSRIEQLAADGNRSAKSALAGIRELTLMLAGAQLGITMCSLGLGLVAEPAVAAIFEGALGEWFSLSDTWTHLIGFTLALSIVVFLHMVVGEMAPKSWAISHPENSAMKLARPFRAFVTVFRPVIWLMNSIANVVVKAVGRRAAGRAGDGALAGRPAAAARRIGRARWARRHRARTAHPFAGAVRVDRLRRDDGPSRHHRRVGRLVGAGGRRRSPSHRAQSDHRVRGRPRPRQGVRPRQGPAAAAERDVGVDPGRCDHAPGDGDPRAPSARRPAARDADRASAHRAGDRRARHGGRAGDARGRDRGTDRRLRRRVRLAPR